MPLVKIEEEHGRFKVWLGSLGALQKGHSSLDYRLRESAVMQANVLTVLRQLRLNLDESIDVISGARLPFELQVRPDFSSDEDESDESKGIHDGLIEIEPKIELKQRLSSIIKIMSNLYQLSFKIRNTNTRSRPARTILIKEEDRDTGIDVFDSYAHFDKRFVQELLDDLRAAHSKQLTRSEDNNFLVGRLSRAITRRRKQFRYWKKHGSKLATAYTDSEFQEPSSKQSHHDASSARAPELILKEAEKRMLPLDTTPSIVSQSIFSTTEATTYDKRLDDALETQSIISYATTTNDMEGDHVPLPIPPTEASTGSGFVCPYCSILCPPRHGAGRAWRAHLLNDLQPYMCTYPNCPDPDEMYSTRRSWLEHEGSVHRKVWRCFEHVAAIVSSQGDYRQHLQDFHSNKVAQEQVTDMLDIGETYVVDGRSECPVCLDLITSHEHLHDHLASHLLRIASFAFPRDFGEDEQSQTGSDSPEARTEASQPSWAAGSLDFSSNPDRREHSIKTVESLAEEVPNSGGYVEPNNPSPSDVAAQAEADALDDDLFAVRLKRSQPPSSTGTVSHAELSPQGMLRAAAFGDTEQEPDAQWFKGQLIGKGELGNVYLGINAKTGELLAVKQIDITEKAVQQALKDQIDTISMLDHHNLMQWLGCEIKMTVCNIFMEYCPIGSVGPVIRKYGRLEEPIIQSFTRQTLTGLVYLHSEGFVQCGLDTDRLLLDNDGTVKISFTSPIRVAIIGGENDSPIGSPFFMAPEIIRNMSDATEGYTIESDVWTVGCIVLHMASGRHPWSKEDVDGAIYKLGSRVHPPPIPADVSNNATVDLMSFMYDCLTIDPTERPNPQDLLDRHSFCAPNVYYNFLDTELYEQLGGRLEDNEPNRRSVGAPSKPSARGFATEASERLRGPWANAADQIESTAANFTKKR